MEYDLHSNLFLKVALNPAPITTDVVTVGNIIDTQGFDSLEYIVTSKLITDGSYVFVLEEGDLPNMSDNVPVPLELVLGTSNAFFQNEDDDVRRVGSIGKKRYQRLSIVSNSVTTGVDIMAAYAILGNVKTSPAQENK